MADDDSAAGSPPAGAQKISDAWISVSHSHLDLEAVRRIRDEFERLHAIPLLFFLLALNEDDEIDDLIKREITARNFFLLCDSPNARASNWVQKERAFVHSLKGRKINELDLSWPWADQRRVIHEALGEATSFLSYSSRDQARVQPYIDLLVKNDFAVFDYRQELRAGGQWQPLIETAIKKSLNGYFILFLTRNWMESRWALAEFGLHRELASQAKDARSLVIALDPLATVRPPFIADQQFLDFSRGSAAEHEEELLRALHLRGGERSSGRSG
jgi:hypothetical protein